jgi:hypothetical protein
MAENESVHAAKLRELGFRQIPEDELIPRPEDPDVITIDLGPVPESWKNLKPDPGFWRSWREWTEEGFSDPFTRADDELRGAWVADGHVDLTPLGFFDHGEIMAAMNRMPYKLDKPN